jgi:hypothetical protein
MTAEHKKLKYEDGLKNKIKSHIQEYLGLILYLQNYQQASPIS